MPGHRLSARIHQLGTSPLAFRRRLRLAAALLLAAACGGCAAFSPDGGIAVVNGIVAPELKSEVLKVNGEDVAGEAHARAAHLLGSTLSADGAVGVALLNNKGLQASYNELGIAEAAMVEASLPPNPTFSLSRIQTMMGMFIVHPRDENFRRVDRDFVFMMSSYAIDPGTALPRVSEMTDFNMWTWNNRVFPGIDPLPVRLGDKVRVRMANLTMTNHPMHLHGFRFAVTGTAAAGCRRARNGRMPPSMCRSARSAPSISSPTIRATGRFTATSRTTP
jgi:hypothetical protein